VEKGSELESVNDHERFNCGCVHFMLQPHNDVNDEEAALQYAQAMATYSWIMLSSSAAGPPTADCFSGKASESTCSAIMRGRCD
jgi:hypothetical protein